MPLKPQDDTDGHACSSSPFYPNTSGCLESRGDPTFFLNPTVVLKLTSSGNPEKQEKLGRCFNSGAIADTRISYRKSIGRAPGILVPHTLRHNAVLRPAEPRCQIAGPVKEVSAFM